eukprot:TRINITY_DN14408_c0_g1_i1.p1 TRINITY_DN14408_c0_g1~~TRINITY_DN14408_c0_g1_i1.p1  ORF type:complete len:322 (+),score=92.56 TRINITY_DN14408_c0_g1_i1:91-1056(+)
MEIIPILYGLWSTLGMNRYKEQNFENTEEDMKNNFKDLEKKFNKDGTRVKIISLNLWMHHLSLAIHKKERLESILKKIGEGDYDVLMIQELWLLRIGPFAQQMYVDMFMTGIRKLGYIHHSHPYGKDNIERRIGFTIGNNSGLLIASKYPILESNYENFNSGKELLNFKGFLRSTISINQNKIHFITCHLNSRKNAELRTSQLKQIKDEMNKVYNKDMEDKQVNGFVVAGDWNICSKGIKAKDDGREYQKLSTLMHPLYDIFDEPKYKDSFTYFDDRSFRDHCFISPNLEIVSHDLFDWKTLDYYKISCSDHLGLEFELKI